MIPKLISGLIILMLIPSITANQCVITIREPPELIPIITNYTETNITSVQHFLNHLEPCPWGSVCGMSARYTLLEAEKVNLSIGEITIHDWNDNRVKKLLADGHQVNTFTGGNIQYYTCNLFPGDPEL